MLDRELLPTVERNPLVLFLAELGVALAEREREIAERRANIHVMTRWTHALRRPGPHPDQCVAEVEVLGSTCLCSRPGEPASSADPRCPTCGHELVPVFSGRPSDSPEPPR